MSAPPIAPSRWLLALVVVAAGVLGIVTIWTTVAVLGHRGCGWMALLAAVDVALLLRLVKAPPGRARMALALAATVVAIAASLWMIAATQMGLLMGLDPLPSAARLGWVLAWELTRHGLDGWDWLWIALALPLAVAMARGPAAGAP